MQEYERYEELTTKNQNAMLLTALAEIQKLQYNDDAPPSTDEMRILRSLAKDLQGEYSDEEEETNATTTCWVGDQQLADEGFDLLCLSELRLKARQLSQIDFGSNTSLSRYNNNSSFLVKSGDSVGSTEPGSPSRRQTREEKIQELRELIKNSPILARGAPTRVDSPSPHRVVSAAHNPEPQFKAQEASVRSGLARPGPKTKKVIPPPLPITTVSTITKLSPQRTPADEQPDEEFEALQAILPADFDVSHLSQALDHHFSNFEAASGLNSGVNTTPSTTVASPRSANGTSSSTTPSSGSRISGMTATEDYDDESLTSNSDISPYSSIPNRSGKHQDPMNTIAKKSKITEVVGMWAGEKEPTREEKIAQVVGMWKKNRTGAPPTDGSAPHKDVKITEVVSAWLKKGGDGKSSMKGKSSGERHHLNHRKLFSSKDKKDKKEKDSSSKDKKEKDKKDKKEKEKEKEKEKDPQHQSRFGAFSLKGINLANYHHSNSSNNNNNTNGNNSNTANPSADKRSRWSSVVQ